MSGLAKPSSLGATSGEVGAGITAQVGSDIDLFAFGSCRHSRDHKADQSRDESLGLTVK